MQTWKTRSKTKLLQFGKWLTVEQHSVELPDGRVIDDWPWLITPDYINVLAVTPQQEALVFRQVKYAVQGETLASVGGYIEPGEDPLLAAKRELLEETGYQAPEWTFLGQYRVDANRGAGTGYMYLARGAQLVAARNADDLEEQDLLRMNLVSLGQALREGQFKVMAWALSVSLGLLALRDSGEMGEIV